jgi:hypothetical protein
MDRMRLPMIPAVVTAVFLAACGAQSSIKPAEILDERTGVTVGALQEPIEFVESAQNAALAGGKRTSFAYLGPVEWDKSGDLAYGLWIHVAPGNDRQAGDIRARGAVTLLLDGAPQVLSPIDPPKVGSGPYRPIASWGQTGYYDLNVDLLKRMAASERLALKFRAVDDSIVDFAPTHETRMTLTKFMHSRGITAD